MAGETAKPAGSSGQESRPGRMLKSLRDMKEFVLNLSDEEWKALDENAPNRCSTAEFAAYCTEMEAPVSASVTPKQFPSLPGTFEKEAVLPVEGELGRRWEAEAEAPSTSSQRAPEGNDATYSMIVGMVRKIQMPVQEAIQRVASFQMWMPLKEKTELRQKSDAEVSSVPEDLRMSPVAVARSAPLTILRRVKDRLVPFLCCFSQAPSLQSGLSSLWDLSHEGCVALNDRHQWPEHRPVDQVSLHSCTVEVIETLVHLYKAEIKDTPQSQQVQKLTSDDFQALCTHVVWDLLKTRVELFLVETPTTITNAWASHSVLPMLKLSTEGSKHLSEAAGDICTSLLEYLITPDAAVSSVLSEAVSPGEARFYPPLDLYLTVQGNLRDFVAKLNKSEITTQNRIGEEGHRDGRYHPGNITGPYITPSWSDSALETAWGWNGLLEDLFGLDRRHSEGSLDKLAWALMPFIQPRFRVGSEEKGGTYHKLPTSPSRADSALVLETSVEDSNHCSTSLANDSCSTRPVPAAAKMRKLPTFRFGKKLNKVHPFEKNGEEHQSTSYGNPQEASRGESEASAPSFKKLRKRLSRIFRAMTKA